MLVRTWPYGTTKRAKVLSVEQSVVRGRVVQIVVLQDDDGQGHVLLQRAQARVQAGDDGTLTFTRGGPMGGYFEFTRDQ